MMNQENAVGFMVADAKLRKTRDGTPVTNFAIVVDRDYKVNGKRPSDLIRCVTFGQMAVNLVNFTQKSTLVSITGRLENGQYTDRSTGKSYDSYRVNVSNFTALAHRKFINNYHKNRSRNNYSNDDSQSNNANDSSDSSVSWIKRHL